MERFIDMIMLPGIYKKSRINKNPALFPMCLIKSLTLTHYFADVQLIIF